MKAGDENPTLRDVGPEPRNRFRTDRPTPQSIDTPVAATTFRHFSISEPR